MMTIDVQCPVCNCVPMLIATSNIEPVWLCKGCRLPVMEDGEPVSPEWIPLFREFFEETGESISQVIFEESGTPFPVAARMAARKLQAFLDDNTDRWPKSSDAMEGVQIYTVVRAPSGVLAFAQTWPREDPRPFEPIIVTADSVGEGNQVMLIVNKAQ